MMQNYEGGFDFTGYTLPELLELQQDFMRAYSTQFFRSYNACVEQLSKDILAPTLVPTDNLRKEDYAKGRSAGLALALVMLRDYKTSLDDKIKHTVTQEAGEPLLTSKDVP